MPHTMVREAHSSHRLCSTPLAPLLQHTARTAPAAQAVENGEEVVLPSGVRYTDLVRGGGQRGAPGQLMVLNLK